MNYNLDTEDGMSNSIDWFLGCVAHIVNGGVWGIPRSFTAYKVDHGAKALTRMHGCDPSTERVAKAAGWKVQTDE